MFTTDLVNLYNRNIFKTSLYIYIFQDEKCRLLRNLSLSMIILRLEEFMAIWDEINNSGTLAGKLLLIKRLTQFDLQ